MDKNKHIKALNDTANMFIEKEGNLNHKGFLRFFDRIQDQQNYIAMLSESDTDYDELTDVLEFSFPIIEDILDKYIDCNDTRKAIFDIGRLYGTMQLSSRICYEKKKDNQVYEAALSVCGTNRFDDIVSLLNKREELTQSELCEELNMAPSELCESIKQLINTDMVVSRRSGKFKAYALSDDGLRFAELRSIEKEHEKEFSSAINDQYQEEMSGIESTIEKLIEYVGKQNEGLSKSPIKGYDSNEGENDDVDIIFEMESA